MRNGFSSWPITVTLVLALICPSLASDEPAGALAGIVDVEFPSGGYRFTVAAAAKGVRIDYRITVARDTAGVIALPHPPSYRQAAGASGLHPLERIEGNGNMYCLSDFGLAFEPQGVPKILAKGDHLHSIEWDGRNWTGPSDFGNPKGAPFPAGTYEVTVTLHGKVADGDVTTPYNIVRSATLILED